MKTIWKFGFEVKGDAHIVVWMPRGAEILCVQAQNDHPCIWALVDDAAIPSEPRYFELYGTGHPFRDGGQKYVGTFQVHGGSFVGHLFERIGS